MKRTVSLCICKFGYVKMRVFIKIVLQSLVIKNVDQSKNMPFLIRDTVRTFIDVLEPYQRSFA